MSTTEWPELVGMNAKEGEDRIRKEYKNICIQVVREGSMVTMDFRTDRVRIFVDDQQKIVQVPCIG